MRGTTCQPRMCDFVVLDRGIREAGSGRGLRVLAGGKRRAIAWLTPSTGCQGCLDVWASAVVLGSHSNHVRAPSLRLREAWFEIESGGWGCKRAVYIGQVCRRLPPMYPVMQRRWRYSRSSWVEREPRPSPECAPPPSYGVELVSGGWGPQRALLSGTRCR